MFNLRWVIFGLILIALSLQIRIWFSDDGYRKSLKLKNAVADQKVLNNSLRTRNNALDAEVLNLKQGSDAAEELARNDLGMIGENETFYQVIPRDESNK
ncbi:MAG: cell division protein FtsB [Woeseia sp.]|nr:cell division protein FtsB [Woeseia sp.]